MRYDSARLAGFPDASGAVRRPHFDGPFFTLTVLLLTAGALLFRRPRLPLPPAREMC